MAAPTFVNKGAFASGIGALTVAQPADIAAGDLLLLFVESANQDVAIPSGWTLVPNSPIGTGTAAAAGGVRLTVLYKITSGAESSVSIADTGDHTTAIIMAYRGVDQDNPFDTTASKVDSTGTTSMAWPTVTTTQNDTLLVLAVAMDTDASSTATVTNYSMPSGHTAATERHDQTVASGDGGGIVVADTVRSTAGGGGAMTATGSTAVTHAYLTIPVRPFIPPTPTAPLRVAQYANDHATIAPVGTTYSSTQTPYLDFSVTIDSISKTEEVTPSVEIEPIGTAFNDVATHTTGEPMIWNSDIPAPRRGGQVIYDSVRERFILLYGAVGSSYLTDVYELSTRDSSAGNTKWRKLSPTGTAPAQRYYFGGGFDELNNRAYIWGGYNGADLGDFWELSFANSRDGAWTQRTPTGTSPAARANIGQSTAYDAKGQKFWLFAGWGASYYNDVNVLDLSTTVPAWTNLKANGAVGSPAARRNALCLWDKNRNQLIMYGGNTSGTANKSDVWKFNLSTNTFTQIATAGSQPPIAELQTGAIDHVNNRMLVWGGWTGSAGTQIREVWELDLVNETWTNKTDSDLDSIPMGNYGSFSALDTKHNYWYCFGGVGSDTYEAQRDHTVNMNVVENPITFTSLNKNTFMRALDAPGFAWNPDLGHMMFAGGYSNMTDDTTITTGDHMNSIYTYNPSTNVWENPTLNLHGFFPREGSLLVYDTNRDRYILFGGYTGDGIGLNDTWEIKANAVGDYVVRRMRPTGTLPPGRWLMAGAYDSTNDRIVITQGGEGFEAPNLNDVWSLTFGASEDGAWAQRTPTGTPTTATWGATYANDTDRSRLYIIGGTTSNGGATFTNAVRYLDYSTTNCAWVTGLATGPSARRSSVAVFDPSNDRLMMFAGWTGADNDETWFYDIIGNTWAQATITTKPAARRSHGGTFYNGKMYIAHGRPASGGKWHRDTWELTPNYTTPNSSTWADKVPPVHQRASVRVPGLAAGDYHWQSWASWSGTEGLKAAYGNNAETATDLTVSAPTYNTFEISAIMNNTGGGTTYLTLWNRTDNVQVTGAEISTSNSYPTLVRGSFEIGATGFSDLKDYEFRLKASSGTANVWSAKLFIRLKNLTKAMTYNRVSKFGYAALSSAAATTANRFLYTAADYSSPVAAWEITGVEDTNGTNNFSLYNVTTTDSGTTGTSVAGTGVDVNTTTKTRQRVSSVSLVNTNRYIGIFNYTSGGARYHHGVLAIQASNATPGTTVSSIIELMDTGRSSQLTTDWTPISAITPFRPDNYDNATFYFEAIGTNSNTTIAYPVKLIAVNSLGQETEVGSITFNTSTGSSNVRYRSSAITFPNGTETVKVKVPGTATAKNVVVGNARIIVKQAAGTKSVIQVPMGGSNNEENTQTGWPIVTTTQTTYGVLANNVDQFTIWRRDDSEFATYWGYSNDPPVVVLDTANNTTFTDSTPPLAFTGTDANGDVIQYNLQVSTSSTFDSTVGYTTSGALVEDLNYTTIGFRAGNKYTFASQVSITEFWAAVTNTYTSGGFLVAKIFNDSSGAVGTLVATSSTSEVVGTATRAFRRFTFATDPVLAAGTYWIAVEGFANGDANTTTIAYDTGGGANTSFYKGDDTGTYTYESKQYSMYVKATNYVLNKSSDLDPGFSAIVVEDDFNDNSLNSTKWGNYGTGVAEVNQRLELTSQAASGWRGIYSNTNYNLTGNSCQIQLINAGNQSLASFEVFAIQLNLDSNNRLKWIIGNNNIYDQRTIAGTTSNISTVAYNSTNHKYFRIRESGGTVYWDHSADGVTWTNHASIANPFAVTSMQIEIATGNFNAEATGTTASLDNVRFLEASPYPSALQVTYEPTSALADNTYYWRVRGIDPTGSNTYGDWATYRTFIVSVGGIVTGYKKVLISGVWTAKPVKKFDGSTWNTEKTKIYDGSTWYESTNN